MIFVQILSELVKLEESTESAVVKLDELGNWIKRSKSTGLRD